MGINLKKLTGAVHGTPDVKDDTKTNATATVTHAGAAGTRWSPGVLLVGYTGAAGKGTLTCTYQATVQWELEIPGGQILKLDFLNMGLNLETGDDEDLIFTLDASGDGAVDGSLVSFAYAREQ